MKTTLIETRKGKVYLKRNRILGTITRFVIKYKAGAAHVPPLPITEEMIDNWHEIKTYSYLGKETLYELSVDENGGRQYFINSARITEPSKYHLAIERHFNVLT